MTVIRNKIAARKEMLKKLALYFAGKGKILDFEEYKAATDRPYRMAQIREVCRSYTKMVTMVVGMNQNANWAQSEIAQIELDLEPNPNAYETPSGREPTETPVEETEEDDE